MFYSTLTKNSRTPPPYCSIEASCKTSLVGSVSEQTPQLFVIKCLWAGQDALESVKVSRELPDFPTFLGSWSGHRLLKHVSSRLAVRAELKP